eukprot:364233-Chlamydomonas_euryale.AAC.16
MWAHTFRGGGGWRHEQDALTAALHCALRPGGPAAGTRGFYGWQRKFTVGKGNSQWAKGIQGGQKFFTVGKGSSR